MYYFQIGSGFKNCQSGELNKSVSRQHIFQTGRSKYWQLFIVCRRYFYTHTIDCNSINVLSLVLGSINENYVSKIKMSHDGFFTLLMIIDFILPNLRIQHKSGFVEAILVCVVHLA